MTQNDSEQTQKSGDGVRVNVNVYVTKAQKNFLQTKSREESLPVALYVRKVLIDKAGMPK